MKRAMPLPLEVWSPSLSLLPSLHSNSSRYIFNFGVLERPSGPKGQPHPSRVLDLKLELENHNRGIASRYMPPRGLAPEHVQRCVLEHGLWGLSTTEVVFTKLFHTHIRFFFLFFLFGFSAFLGFLHPVFMLWLALAHRGEGDDVGVIIGSLRVLMGDASSSGLLTEMGESSS